MAIRDPSAALLLGLDLGTSAVKAVLLDRAGRVVAAGSGEFPTDTAADLRAEQDPADWLAATAAACAGLAAGATDWRERVSAIGLTGQLPTLVRMGRTGPLGAAITWKDARADVWAAGMIDARERRALYERTGMPIDGRYLAPMYLFHGAPAGETVTTLLSAKDFLCWALTGERYTDPSTAAGYGVYDLAAQAFSAVLGAPWATPAQLLPDVLPSRGLAGVLHARGAALLGLGAGTPVTVGAADSVASAYAMAGLEQGVVCVTMGSSTIILDAVRERRLDPATRYLLTPHVAPGWFGREMDLLATGTGYRWLSELFGWRAGELDAAAARVAPGANGLSFAPYLAGGEQGALWDPALRGSIRGLGLHHGRDDLARAFLEGVCFEIRRCVDVLAEVAPVHRVVVAGHMAAQPASVQLLADVLDRPVALHDSVSPAAIGAALCAASIAGWGDVPPSPAPGAVVQPGPAAAAYRSLYARYVDAVR